MTNGTWEWACNRLLSGEILVFTDNDDATYQFDTMTGNLCYGRSLISAHTTGEMMASTTWRVVGYVRPVVDVDATIAGLEKLGNVIFFSDPMKPYCYDGIRLIKQFAAAVLAMQDKVDRIEPDGDIQSPACGFSAELRHITEYLKSWRHSLNESECEYIGRILSLVDHLANPTCPCAKNEKSVRGMCGAECQCRAHGCKWCRPQSTKKPVSDSGQILRKGKLYIRFNGDSMQLGPRFIEAEIDGVSVDVGEWVKDGDDQLLVFDEFVQPISGTVFFRPTGKVGLAKAGDWYCSADGGFYQARKDHDGGPTAIYVRTVIK